MELIELNKEGINRLNLNNLSRAFQFVKDNTQIGYALILNEENNELLIYVEEPYRGNGYGTELFSKMLKIMNKEIKVKTNNDIMKNIINKFRGLEISNKNSYTIYVIPKIDI